MSVKEVIKILDELAEQSAGLEVLDGAKALASQSWGLGQKGKDASQAVLSILGESANEIAQLRPKLIQALLELSHDEASELLNRIKGTPREMILSRNFIADDGLARTKIKIMNLFWPEYDKTKMADITMQKLRSREPAHEWNLLEKQAFAKEKERFLSILLTLKDYIKLVQANPNVQANSDVLDIIGLTLVDCYTCFDR